jgi:cytochrome c oxidase subunit 3
MPTAIESEAPAGVGGQFAGRAHERHAALMGMWAFLATEVLFFGAMFGAYAIYRMFYGHAFAEGGKHMSRAWGAANTALLLGGSVAMALGLGAARRGAGRRAAAWMALTGLSGVGFLAVKAHEWIAHAREGLFPVLGRPFRFPGPEADQARLFFDLYYAMTGLHAVHLAIGVGAVSVMAVFCLKGRYRAGDVTPVELTGLYWHFVDVVWVFLFPLFYLVR